MEKRHVLYADRSVTETYLWVCEKQKGILMILWIIKEVVALNIQSSTLFLLGIHNMKEKDALKERKSYFKHQLENICIYRSQELLGSKIKNLSYTQQNMHKVRDQ